MKRHVKKNDLVVVIAGNYRGVRGKVLSVNPRKQRAVVTLDRPVGNQDKKFGVYRKAVRKTQDRPQGGFVELDRSYHLSNVMLAETYDKRRSAPAA